MEASFGAHHLSRRLKAFGHDARLMPAKYARAFLKGNKNDYRDAEAIAEAVQRPTMRFVATKTEEQLDLQALYRVRSRLVSERTAKVGDAFDAACHELAVQDELDPVLPRWRAIAQNRLAGLNETETPNALEYTIVFEGRAWLFSPEYPDAAPTGVRSP